MATATTPQATPSTEVSVWNTITLFEVDWATYCTLRDNPANDRVRMAYLDGTLILMSPAFLHDRSAEVFGLLIRGVARGSGLRILGTGSATLRRPGDGPVRGSGKEPDTSFYIGENERRMRKKTELDLTIDPPPDLAIEVENTRNSEAALPIYARLRVPEVWRYDVRAGHLWFGRLVDGQYVEVQRSGCLPRLTPALVLQALTVLDESEMDDNEWSEWVKAWTRGLPETA